MNKKIAFAIGAVVVAVAAIGLEWRAFHNNGAADQANLNKQLAANGMPSGGPGGMPDPKQMQAQMMDNMVKQVGLNTAQSDQIKSIRQNTFTQMDGIFKDRTLSQSQKMERIQELGHNSDAQIKAVMTPEQQTKYDAMQKSMGGPSMMAGRRSGGPGGGPDIPGGSRGGPGGSGQFGPPPGMPGGSGQFGPPPGMPGGGSGGPDSSSGSSR